VDITVKRTEGETAWNLVDLLGRSMGRIVEDSPESFSIHPDGFARETMNGMRDWPYASLDAALRGIETFTRGVCRLDEDRGQ
jgi:hypothetical protein